MSEQTPAANDLVRQQVEGQKHQLADITQRLQEIRGLL